MEHGRLTRKNTPTVGQSPNLAPVEATRRKNQFYCVCSKIRITPPDGESSPERRKQKMLLVLLIVLILVFGLGGYRMGPGLGYYGGGGISLILIIVLLLLLLKVI